ncbi:tyrosine-type recombinase/integrase [Chromobacterium haemolyticum]|uniref:Integrase n=1 Tax=Chromobacterium haemolyticum TaxID=394935 RepID=A0A1W0CMR1_9NEIS|nr:tyrosine-type recombinase/integrase [Chromobacterium haemolyticum]OQS36115.1 integrase [Chromobacterium haemolyticum]
MARKQITGLTQRTPGGVWFIDKQVQGVGRIRESTGTHDRAEAEKYLIHKLEKIRQQQVYGIRPPRIWREAATKYLLENQHMPSIGDCADQLKILDKFIGDVELSKLHDGSMREFIKFRQTTRLDKRTDKEGVTPRTINIALELVIRILALAASKWRDEFGMTWLERPPSISKLNERAETRPAYPMSWDEQKLLFKELPEHLAIMALFKVNTGCREKEVCYLKWEWEVRVPELETSVFLIPANFGGRTDKSGVKNGSERIVVLNSVARSIIETLRGRHPVYVFAYHESANPNEDNIQRMNGHAWRKARTRAAQKFAAKFMRRPNPGFAKFRVHDLKHTFGYRLRIAGVPFEDRQVLLGHTSENVTTHYSAAEVGRLIEQVELVKDTGRQLVSATVIRRSA